MFSAKLTKKDPPGRCWWLFLLFLATCAPDIFHGASTLVCPTAAEPEPVPAVNKATLLLLVLPGGPVRRPYLSMLLLLLLPLLLLVLPGRPVRRPYLSMLLLLLLPLLLLLLMMMMIPNETIDD